MEKTALVCLATALLPCLSASAQVTGRQAEPRADAQATPTTSSVRGRYVVHCAGCHGLDGAGSQRGLVPDMRRLGRFLQLDGGRAFIVGVPGVMGSGLSDEHVAEVTNWVLQGMARESLPPHFKPYSAEEVKRVRARPLVDVAGARTRLVEQGRRRGIAID